MLVGKGGVKRHKNCVESRDSKVALSIDRMRFGSFPNVEHRNCNHGGGVCFAALLGSDNSCTTSSKRPLSDQKPFVGVVYVWWSPNTILTEMMADEFNFLRPEIKNYKAEADADLIPIPGQLELHG